MSIDTKTIPNSLPPGVDQVDAMRQKLKELNDATDAAIDRQTGRSKSERAS